MARRYRKRRNSTISDITYISSKLSWWGALLLGMMVFGLFYWVLPNWIKTKIATQSSSMFYPMLEASLGRRVHWLKWIGIAGGLIGLFFAARNYCIRDNYADQTEQRVITFLAKISGRNLN